MRDGHVSGGLGCLLRGVGVVSGREMGRKATPGRWWDGLEGKETYEIVELYGGDTSVDTGDDLLGNGNRVDMVGI